MLSRVTRTFEATSTNSPDVYSLKRITPFGPPNLDRSGDGSAETSFPAAKTQHVRGVRLCLRYFVSMTSWFSMRCSKAA